MSGASDRSTSIDAAEAATQQGALGTRGVALIGLYGPSDNLRALVRLRSGRIERVAPGSRLSIGRVLAIDAQGLIVDHHGEAARLPMAGS